MSGNEIVNEDLLMKSISVRKVTQATTGNHDI